MDIQTDGAPTIIEKFEKYANIANKAIAIMSKDDQSIAELKGDERFRARQNVLIEIGWFMARLNRRNVLIVSEEGVEEPSDFLGIESTKFQRSLAEKNYKHIESFLMSRRLQP